jgi:hypothetical protein
MTDSTGDARVTADQAISHELRELTDAVAELRTELRRSVGATLPREEAGGWDEGKAAAAHAWVSSLATPQRTAVRIPRLPLELAFLAGAAVLAGIADLRPVEIAAVMGVAWLIVALAEWAGSRGDRMRTQIYLSPLGVPQQPPPAAVTADPTWFTPPVEHTLLASVDDQSTGIATLPQVDDQSTGITSQPPADDPETTAERRAEA